MRSLWKDEAEPFDGRYYRWPKVESHPKPVQKPGVPIVVGGHTELAARRAARYGDGFFPGVADDEKLRWLLGVLRDECAKVGRDPSTIEVTSGRTAPDADGVKRLRDLGVSRFVLPPPAFDPDGITEGLERLGKLIAQVR
jgi:alkanesulfonate monooxygenase SsuD/methylene tetrahydromethanopterin reductase-like flavin-dependent oxidoreductase (luciferase family)